MTYYASIGETLLILALCFSAFTVMRSEHNKTLKLAIASAMSFIAVTATIGAFRFAGFTEVNIIHDTTSWLSTNLAMTIYASVTALLFLNNNHTKKLRVPLVILFIVNTLLSILLTTALTNVVIFLALVITAFYSQQRNWVIAALVALLLVPLASHIPASYDLQMGVFHLFLAAHFILISSVYKSKGLISEKS